MAIDLFDYKDWKDSLYKDLLQAYLKEWSFQDVKNFMASANEKATKKEVDDFMDFMDYLNSIQSQIYAVPIQFGENAGKYAYNIITVEGHYNSVKGLMNGNIKPKPKKSMVDKYVQNVLIMDLITCHQSKGFRKKMGVKKGFFG